jgi:hypothetical protein
MPIYFDGRSVKIIKGDDEGVTMYLFSYDLVKTKQFNLLHTLSHIIQ